MGHISTKNYNTCLLNASAAGNDTNVQFLDQDDDDDPDTELYMTQLQQLQV